MDREVRNLPAEGRTVLVWDVYTRLFHWLTVALVAATYVTWRLNWMDWHALAGEALLALLLFRLAWGFVGSETARFARFLAPPRAVAAHLARLFHREADEEISHNAAGGWMVLVLLALLLGETLTGIVVSNDVADVGPLTDLMPARVANLLTNLHAILWEALLAAIALHVAAIVLYALVKGHSLLPPMVTGRKRFLTPSAPPRRASFARAALVLVGSAAAAALLASFL
ncbi:MAG: cytochrome b/b6 domain-containing protein [Acetobacteraceae bacterium]|nr:cytochrome b/b6 domain-containing protein [Acetobacteraceae bacterium]